MPSVRAIVDEAAASNYQFSSIVMGIVDSSPFRMRIVPEPAAENATAAVNVAGGERIAGREN
jgi:hypothetical protein